ncbi:MAG: hypothetical protein ACRCU1_06465 [Alsobacter sp.]
MRRRGAEFDVNDREGDIKIRKGVVEAVSGGSPTLKQRIFGEKAAHKAAPENKAQEPRPERKPAQDAPKPDGKK